MASYKDIQNYVKKKSGSTPKTCWIADVKTHCGIEVKKAWNRKDPLRRKFTCPANKFEVIKAAFLYFGLI